MGIFSKFEHKVEDGFEGMNDKLFDAPISPVQIAKKAEKQMRREKMVGAGKEFAPTLYTVLVNPDDDERLFGYYPTLAGETETYLRGKAQEEGLVMDGAPLVRFIIDDELRHGKFDIVAEMVSAPIVEQLREEEMQRYGLAGQNASAPAPAAAAAAQTPGAASAAAAQAGSAAQASAAVPNQPYASSGIDIMADEASYAASANAASATPPVVPPIAPPTTNFNEPQVMGRHAAPQRMPRLIDLTTNRSFPLKTDRVLIGRALSSEIAVEDLNVSRTHAELRRETTSTWSVADLGSTNGTLVNGRHIASVMLQEGDRITVGTTTFLFTFQ